jgi:hypothetical protein
MNVQYLYFIENPRFSMIKIGVSNEVQKRVYTLSLACGVELTLLRVIPDGYQYEIPLHRAFQPSRRFGEWFEATDELRALATGNEDVKAWLQRNAAMVKAGKDIYAKRFERMMRPNRTARRDIQPQWEG